MTYVYFHTPDHALVRIPIPHTNVAMARNEARFAAAFVHNVTTRRMFAVVPR